MKNICFFNHWHNGDVFAGKGWMQDIQRQLKDRKFAYSHINKPKIMSDMGAEYFHCDELPEGLGDRQKFADSDDEFYINTWIGSYGWDVMPRGEDHANWKSLHRMFEYIYQQINSSTGANLSISADPLNYVATTDWSAYDTSKVDAYLDSTVADRMHLICNGLVRSTQSNLGTMKAVIENLATKYQSDVFVCTAKFDTDMTNIHFTDDIFADVEGGDLNEIAYLSTKCSTITGKNSGPYMFAHVKENIFDEKKAFVSLSHRASDCYPYGLDGLGCIYLHCSSDDESRVTQVIDSAIQRLGTKSPGKVEILD